MFRDFGAKNGTHVYGFFVKTRPIWAAHPRIAFLWEDPPPRPYHPFDTCILYYRSCLITGASDYYFGYNQDIIKQKSSQNHTLDHTL